MDIECIVCGSPHNEQALRCVVCGADLPGSGGDGRTQGYALDLPQPLQTITPAAPAPPTSGFGGGHEPDQADPLAAQTAVGFYEQLQPDASAPLKPADLKISEPPRSRAQQMTLSGGPIAPESFDPSVARSYTSQHQPSQSAHSHNRAPSGSHAHGIEAERSAELEAQLRLTPSAQTWIGVPIPQVDHLVTQGGGSAYGAAHEAAPRDVTSRDGSHRDVTPNAAGESYPQLFSINPTALGAPQDIEESMSASSASSAQDDRAVRSAHYVQPPWEKYASSDGDHSVRDPIMDHIADRATNSASDQRIAYRVDAQEELNGREFEETSNAASASYAHAQPSLDSSAASEAHHVASRDVSESERSLRVHSEHQNTSELPSVRLSGGMGWLTWALLILTSITLGVGVALYILDPEIMSAQAGADARAEVTSLRYDQGTHLIRLSLTSTERAQLLVPESWVGAEHREAFKPAIGTRDVTLQLRSSQLELGETLLSAQWRFPDREQGSPSSSQPAAIKVPLWWEVSQVEALDQDTFNVKINLASDVELIESDVAYSSLGQQKRQLKIPRSSVVLLEGSQRIANVKITLKRGDQTMTHDATFKLPAAALPPVSLTVLSPVHNYARPEPAVTVSGVSAPGALLEVRASRATSPEPDLDVELKAAPIASARADEAGSFKITVPLTGEHAGRAPVGVDGDLWRLEVTASHAGATEARERVMIKRSHAGKWYRYYNRMRARRDKAKRKYRLFTYAKLTSKTEALLGKSGQLKGVIGEIVRGATPEEQRLLVYTCSRGDRCPIWVNDSQAFWVREGQKIYVFSVFKGVKTHRASGGEITAPELEARLTTP